MAVLVAGATALAQAPSQNGATWLLTQQGVDGSFGGATGTDKILTTVEVVTALTPILGAKDAQLGAALAFLRSQTPPEHDLQARILTVLAGTPLADTLGATLFQGAALGQGGYAFVGADSYPTPLETAEAIDFLSTSILITAATAPPSLNTAAPPGCSQTSVICATITPYLTFLLGAQNADGGWGFVDEGSDVRLTSEILSVLMPLRSQLQIDSALSAAAQFVVAQAAADGHFGTATPPTADTAVAAIGLIGAPNPQTSAILAADAFLNGSQGTDGSWDESELNTALALRALQAGAGNLQVTPANSGLTGSTTLSSQTAQAGGTVTASVTVANNGGSASQATTVTFTAVEPDGGSVDLGTFAVPVTDAGADTTVTETLSTAGLSGDYQIVATIGSQSAPGQDQSGAALQVATEIDLSIEPSDIQFTKVDAGLVEISVTVHENGLAVSQPFEVGIYQGDPDAGALHLAAPTISFIDGGGAATVTVPWNPSTADGPTPIYAVADVQGVIPDSNRANNKAFRDFDTTSESIDLEVFSGGVVFEPTLLHPDVDETVQVSVTNTSAFDAYDVQVALCLASGELQVGCPAGSDTLISSIDRVPAKSAAFATFTFPGSEIILPPEGTFGELFFNVVADPFDLIVDPNRANNIASAGVEVSLSASIYAQLSVACPQYSPTGQLLSPTIFGVFAQTSGGNAVSLPVPFTIYQGAPEEGGSPIYSGIVPSGTEEVKVQLQPSLDSDPLYVLVLDPDNTLQNLTPYLAEASAVAICVTTPTSQLTMTYDDIRFSPVGPSVGESTTVTATVHNAAPISPAFTTTAVLKAFVGDPSRASGQEVAEFPISLDPQTSATVSFSWTRTGEETNLFFGLFDIVPTQYLTYSPNETGYYTYRNAFLEAVYTSGRTSTYAYAYGLAPITSPPTIGDLLRTGHPVIGYGDCINSTDGGAEQFYGSLTLIQKLPDNSVQTLWNQPVDECVGQPVFVDLGIDAGPQIVFLSVVGPYANASAGQSHAFRGNTIHVWNPDGTVAWERSYVLGPDGGPADACMNEDNLVAPGVGDVNGDGVVDVVFPTADGIVHVLDGRTGNPIWETHLPASETCRTYENEPAGWQPSVLDLGVDGGRAVVVGVSDLQGFSSPSRGNVRIYSATGQDLTGDGGGAFPQNVSSDVTNGNLVVTDFAGPGTAPTLFSTTASGLGQAVSPTGQLQWQFNTNVYQLFSGPFAVADGTANGTPALFIGTLGGPLLLGADGGVVWAGDLGGTDGYPTNYSPVISRAVAAADLFGIGSPQYLGVSNENALFILDGRTGTDLLKTHVFIADDGNSDDEGEFSDLAIADVDGDGHGEVVVNVQPDGTDYGYSPGYESHASLYIFGSDAHWQDMPNVWSGNQYHHQFNPDLTLTQDAYAPWTTHNTWRAQFVTAPVDLTPDLELGRFPDGGSDIRVTPVSPLTGATASVSVTVHNIGGAAASEVPVALYLGDPDAGGTLIGTQTIAGPLAVRTGSGVATFSWVAWPEGVDELFAVANPPLPDGGRAIVEVNYVNGETFAPVYVGPGTNLADLEIGAADISFNPAFAVGGTLVSVSATVHNLGVAAAGSFAVAFTDGAGGNGPSIGTIPLAGLAAGGETTVTATGWLPSEGPHLVTVVADPQHVIPDSNLSNNTAVTSYVVGQSGLPDPAVAASDLTFSPVSPVKSGTIVQLTSVIHNYGSAVEGVPIVITADPGTVQATPLASLVLEATLEPGAAVPLATSIDTALLAGTGRVAHVIQVQVNPRGTIQEYDTANDLGTTTLTVVSGEVQVAVATDQSSYPANTTATITVGMSSEVLASASYTLNVQVQTLSGVPVVSVAAGWSEILGGGVSNTEPFGWNTASTAPGSYLAVATLTDPASGLVIAKGEAPFTIQADETVALVTGPMLQAYQPGSSAVIVTRIEDGSQNTAFQDLGLVVSVATPDGGTFYSSTRTGLSVGRAQDLTKMDSVSLALSAIAGSYPITATLTQDGSPFASASGTLIVQTASVATGLTATLTAVPAAFVVGTTVELSASITDVGNVPFSSEPVDIEVGNPTTQTVLADFSSQQTFALGQTVPLSDPYNSTGLSPGDYLAAVIVNGTPLANTVLHAGLPDAGIGMPPTITVSGVTPGELTDQPVTPVITVAAETPTYIVTATLNGQPFASGTTISGGGSYTLAITATDAFGNSSSTTLQFTIYQAAPVILITGVTNGEITNAASVTPVITITDSYLDLTKTVILLNGSSFVSGTPVTAEGSYLLTVSAQDLAGNTASAQVSFVIDRTPPAISVAGVTDGECIPGAVSPTVTVTDLHLDPSKTVITLDGQPFVSGTEISAAGQHSLSISAADLASNTSSVAASFTLDPEPPAITIAGVTNGEVINIAQLAPTVTITDPGTLASQSVTLNGQPYVSETPITAEGSYTLVATATNCAGLTSTVQVVFAIDRTPPAIVIAGVASGTCSPSPVTPVVSLFDPNLDPAKTVVTLNGVPFASGSTVSTPGKYTLVAMAADLAGNSSSASAAFTVDLAGPTILVTGVNNGEYSNAPSVTPVVTISDVGALTQQSIVLNSQPVVSGTAVTLEGNYQLQVSATDCAGLSANTSVDFVLDRTPPTITIGGVTNGEYSNAAQLIPTITIADANLDPSKTKITLNGQPFVSGTAITAEGTYALTAFAEDFATNSTTTTVTFTIDRTPPSIVVTGVRAGECTSSPVSPIVTVTDPDLNTALTVITLNGQPFVSGSTVAAQGQDVLAVSATDQAGNVATVTVAYTIDKTAPSIVIAGVSSGEVVNVPSLSPTVTITDVGALTTQSITLNGQPYASGTAITAENDYVLAVTATDCAGLSASASVSFAIDRTPPTITVTGITNGEYSNAAQLAPTITVTDAHPNPSATVITLNGQTYVSGTAITTEGSYTLSVTAADLAGNQASATYTFVIDRTPPVIAITAVTNGEVSNGPVTPVIAVTDAHPNPAATVITLDGQPFVSGTTITAMGMHTLDVSATDLAGNQSQASVTFDVRGPAPTFGMGVCANSVTMDNQAQITAPGATGQPQLLGTPGSLSEANQASVKGSAVVGGNASLTNQASITGTLYLGGTETLKNQSTVGTTVQESPAPSPCCPYNIGQMMQNAAADNDNPTLPAAIQNLVNKQGAFSASNQTQVVFPAGRYYFTGFTLANQAKVTTQAGAMVQLFVNGSVAVDNQSVLSGVPSNPSTLTIVASGAVDLDNQNVTNVAFLYGQGVTVENQGMLTGAVQGTALTLGNQATLSVPANLVPSGVVLQCQ